MLNFCTLFDSNYMARGLAMYDSLMKHCKDFHLYIFAFDEQSYQYLKSNAHQYPQTTAIPLATFEDPALLSVKPLRTTAEYCWTCTPSTIAYCIKTFQLNHCTYLDADMLFYSDPSTLINEMKKKSVLISEHRYTREYDQSSYSGIYCVQFMTFKNTEEGMHILNWWREKCIEWCYARLEDGKFGDQKYLDDWPQRFNSVHVLQNKGAGIAPWNMQQYEFPGNDTARYLPDGRQCEIVFVHFHGLKFYSNDNLTLCGPLYELQKDIRTNIYFPYISLLLQKADEIRNLHGPANPNGAFNTAPSNAALLLAYTKEVAKQIKNKKLSPFHLKTFNFSLHHHRYHIQQFL